MLTLLQCLHVQDEKARKALKDLSSSLGCAQQRLSPSGVFLCFVQHSISFTCTVHLSATTTTPLRLKASTYRNPLSLSQRPR